MLPCLTTFHRVIISPFSRKKTNKIMSDYLKQCFSRYSPLSRACDHYKSQGSILELQNPNLQERGLGIRPVNKLSSWVSGSLKLRTIGPHGKPSQSILCTLVYVPTHIPTSNDSRRSRCFSHFKTQPIEHSCWSFQAHSTSTSSMTVPCSFQEVDRKWYHVTYVQQSCICLPKWDRTFIQDSIFSSTPPLHRPTKGANTMSRCGSC